MFEIISPGKGLQPYLLPKLIDTYAKRDFLPGDFLYQSDLPEINMVKPKITNLKKMGNTSKVP